MEHIRTMLVGATVLALLWACPPGSGAQAPGSVGADERERTFVEALRRDDPASAERYVALRDARAQAIDELQRVQAQYNAVGSALQPAFLRPLRQARRKYAESFLALLDFIDARDRRALASYEKEISRINGLLEQHKRTRAELEKLLQGE